MTREKLISAIEEITSQYPAVFKQIEPQGKVSEIPARVLIEHMRVGLVIPIGIGMLQEIITHLKEDK